MWRISDELVLALDRRFGPPTDAYVNGSQVWLRDDGPGGFTVEWRLHPVAGYQRPDGVDTDDVFPAAAFALATEAVPVAAPAELWEGLEAFPAFGDEVEPVGLARATEDAIGLGADACGLADHQAVGDAWEHSRGATSIIQLLLDQLAAGS